MEPWVIAAQEDKKISGTPFRLVLLHRPLAEALYKVYALDRTQGYWELVDRYPLPETDGTEPPEWAMERAWARFKEKGWDLLRSKKEWA